LPCPEAYKETVWRGLHFHAHPDVKSKDLARLKKRIGVARKAFEARHGKLRMSSDNPAIVVVHTSAAQARKMCAGAGDSPHGHHIEIETLRLFTEPIESDERVSAADFARALQMFFFLERYGRATPDWLWKGACRLELAASWTGEKSPAIPASMGPIPESLPAFEHQMSGSDESLYWVLFFRHGPAVYRKAFKACVDEVAETADWDSAVGTHLLSLDQDTMRAAANEFVAKKVELVED